MRYVFALVLAFSVALTARSGENLYLARIAQLEQQLQQVYAQGQLCEAKLITVQQPQVLEQQQKQREKVEQEVGCTINWGATPPVCKE